MSTLRISNIEAKSVPASATIDEKVKITNSSGDVLVFLDGKTSGITTVGINTTDGNITFDANSNIVVTGIITATKFVGTIEPTNLTVGGDLTIPDKIIHTGDTNTAIRFPAADTFSVETAGSEVLRITSDRKVGINRTSPARHLHAYAAGAGFVAKFEGSYSYSAVEFADTGTTNAPYIGSKSDDFTIATGGNNERIRIKSNGIIVAGNDGTSFGNGKIQSFIQHGNTAGESAFSAVDTTSVAAGVGGEIAFHGKYNTGAQDWAYFGHIRGIKENATNGNTACALTFHTRPNATAPQERLRITSDGDMKLGSGATVAGLRYFDVQNSSTAATNHGSILRLITSNAAGNGTTSVDMVKYKDGNFYINNNETSGSTNFNTGGSTRLSIQSNGHLTVTDGNLVMANGRGIDFSATGNGSSSMSSELLDDYEEGSWTASISGGSYITTNAAYYTKIGRMVYWLLHCKPTFAENNANAYYIYGLPYTSANVTQNYGWSANITYTANANNTTIANMRPLVQLNNTYIYFHTVGQGSSTRVANNLIRSSMLNQDWVIGGFYMAAY